jgi:hypothetical protein
MYGNVNGPMAMSGGSSGVAPAPSGSDLVRIRERIEGQTKALAEYATTLTGIADRTYGGEPSADKPAGPPPSVGTVSSLDSALSAHEAALSYLAHQVKRLSGL